MAIIRTKIDADISGIEKLDKAIAQRRATLKAIRAGAKIVQRSAKSAVARQSGALRQSLGIKGAKGKRGKTIAYAVIGPRKKVRKLVKRKGSRRPVLAVPAYYAHLVERGTRPHAIGKGSKLARRGKAGSAGGAQHPGTRARPFIGPAYTSNRPSIARAIQDALAVEIEKEIAKAAVRIAKRGK